MSKPKFMAPPAVLHMKWLLLIGSMLEALHQSALFGVTTEAAGVEAMHEPPPNRPKYLNPTAR